MQNTDFEETAEEKTKIFTIKTQVGKEQNTAELLNSRADKSKIEIPSILVTPELRGYIFLESYDKERIKEMIKTVLSSCICGCKNCRRRCSRNGIRSIQR